MRIINVLTMVMGDTCELFSYPIHNKKDTKKIVAKANRKFKSEVRKYDDSIEKEYLEECLEEELWEGDGYEVRLIWSK